MVFDLSSLIGSAGTPTDQKPDNVIDAAELDIAATESAAYRRREIDDDGVNTYPEKHIHETPLKTYAYSAPWVLSHLERYPALRASYKTHKR